MKMSYQLKIDPKDANSARFISSLSRKIQRELIASGMTQQEIAELLGVDRSVVNRRIKGDANLTARSIAEFAFAFGKELELNFRDGDDENFSNTVRFGTADESGNIVPVSFSEPRAIENSLGNTRISVSQ